MCRVERTFKKQIVSYFANKMDKKPGYVKKHLRFDVEYVKRLDLLSAKVWFQLDGLHELRLDYTGSNIWAWRLSYSEDSPSAAKGTITYGQTVDQTLSAVWKLVPTLKFKE